MTRDTIDTLRWNEEEDAILRRMVAEGALDEEIGRALDRVPGGVQRRRQVMGLRLLSGARYPGQRKNSDLQALRDLHRQSPGLSVEEQMRRTGLTENQVEYLRRVLGIQKVSRADGNMGPARVGEPTDADGGEPEVDCGPVPGWPLDLFAGENVRVAPAVQRLRWDPGAGLTIT